MYHQSMTSSNNWSEIRTWRIAKRKDLIAKRLGVAHHERRSVQQTVSKRIQHRFPELNEAVIGFYWPIKGEIDLRPLLKDLLSEGAEAALPVVVEKDHPVEFWQWHTEVKMSRGIGNIPVPSERKPIQPTVMLIPLIGFDQSGHRLGYGGGYYDRSLMELRLKPMTIGVGYAFGRLPSIYPQEHDYPLDAIVTEMDCTHFNQRRLNATGVSSPPCYLDESD